jgi:predicted ATPase
VILGGTAPGSKSATNRKSGTPRPRVLPVNLTQGHPGQQTDAAAEECFQRALAVARRQGAKTFELRVATSLERLWRDQGKRTEARDVLAAIYSWFTEGSDTPVLQSANALLDELT